MSDIRVSTSAYQQSLIRQIATNQSTVVDLSKQLASRRKVTLPEDDPIVMARTMRRTTEKRELLQFNTNNILAENLIKSSELKLSEMRALGDLAIAIGESTDAQASATERESAWGRLNDLVNQALDLANAKSEDNYLFAGTDFAQDPYRIDDNGTPADLSDDFVVYEGSPTDPSDPNFEEAEYYVGSNTKIAPRLSPQYNEDIQSYIQHILDLRNAFGGPTYDDVAVKAAIADIETSDDRLVVATTDLSLKQLRLETAKKADTALFNQLDGSIAGEVGIDLAEVAVRLNQAQLGYEAALSSSSRILQVSLLDYI